MRITCEIMNYRAGQKLDIIRKTFGESLKSPKEYLINIISSNFTAMSENYQFIWWQHSYFRELYSDECQSG